MTPYKGRLLCLLAILCPLLLLGCGGGSQSVSSGNISDQRGTLTLQVLFPQPLRSVASGSTSKADPGRYTLGDIPDGAFSLKIALTNPSTGAAIIPPRIVTAPASLSGVNTPVTINFAALPLGPIQVNVTAHPDTLGTENPLGVGSGTGTITPLGNTQLHIPLALTAKELKTANKINMSVASPGKMDALILDKDGNLLKTPLVFTSLDTSIATVPRNGISGTPIQVTVTQSAPSGSSVGIKVLEPDSGLATTVTFHVQ